MKNPILLNSTSLPLKGSQFKRISKHKVPIHVFLHCESRKGLLDSLKCGIRKKPDKTARSFILHTIFSHNGNKQNQHDHQFA